jgi:hypothetical protein
VAKVYFANVFVKAITGAAARVPPVREWNPSRGEDLLSIKMSPKNYISIANHLLYYSNMFVRLVFCKPLKPNATMSFFPKLNYSSKRKIFIITVDSIYHQPDVIIN